MYRLSNSYTITCANQQYSFGWDESQPNFIGYLSNITSSVDFRTNTLERSMQDGVVMSDTYLAGRSVAIDLVLLSSDEVVRGAQLRAIGRLAADSRVSDAVIEWVEDDGNYRRVVGRLVASPVIGHEQGAPTKQVQLSFLCRSPQIEGSLFQIEANAGETITAVNVGSSEAYPVITIFGGGTGFTLTWGSNTTQLDLSLNSDEYVTLDSFNKTVNKNGNQAAYAALSASSEFPALPSGSSTDFNLTVAGSSGTPKVRVEWRPAWLF